MPTDSFARMLYAIEDCRVIQLPFECRLTAQAAVAAVVKQGLSNVCALFTCHRSELYVVGTTSAPVVSALAPLMPTFAEPITEITGYAAVNHIFEVASGLRSKVVGEAEILGQLRSSHLVALETGTCHGLLDRIMQGAICAGKRVRSETDLAHGTLSIASAVHAVAVEHARAISSVVIIGAGSIGKKCARLFRSEYGAVELIILNRTIERAREIANEVGATADYIDSLPLHLMSADVVIVAISDTTPELSEIALSIADLLVIDVSSPSIINTIDPCIRARVLTLSDIEHRMGMANINRLSSVPRALQIISEELDALETWSISQRVDPLLRHVESMLRSEGQHEERAIVDLVRSFRRSIFNSIQHRHYIQGDVATGLDTVAQLRLAGE